MTPLDLTSVESVVRTVRRYLVRRGGVAAVLLGLAAAAAALPAAWLLVGPEGWRPGSPLPLLLVAGAGGVAVGLGAWAWMRMRRWTREAVLASEMERTAGLPEGAVRVQLELGRGVPEGTSAGLVRAGETALLSRLGAPRGGLAGAGERDARRLLRGGAVLAGGTAMLALTLLAASPERTRTAWAGLGAPIGVLFPPPLDPLQLLPGDAEVPRGETLEVEVRAPGRERVTLHWEAPGDVPGSTVLSVEDGWAVGRLPPVLAPTRYRASGPGGDESPTYLVEPLDPLLLADLRLEVRYPPHTGLPPEVHAGVPRGLRIPEGSRIDISGTLAGEAASTEVALRDEEGARLASLRLEDGRFEGSWRPVRSGRALWQVTGEAPAGRRLPPPLDVELVPDDPPMVALETESGQSAVPLSLRVPLRIHATDDWGLDWVALEVRLEDPQGRVGEPATDRTDGDGRREIALRPVLDLSGWDLPPGTRIRLTAAAADRAPVPGVTRSRELVLHLPDEGARREGARGSMDEAAERVEALAAEAGRGERELRERAREADARGSRGGSARREGFEDREELRRVLEEQASLAHEVEALREELALAREALGGGEEERGLRERLAELEALLEEMGGPEARERLEALLERLRDGETPPLAEELRDAASRQEALRERLEEAIERFRRAALESAFEGAEEQARDLAEAQDAVAEELGRGEGAERQEALGREAEALRERIQELRDRLERAGEPEAAERAGEAGRDVERSREGMERAAEAARRGDEGAGELGEQAAADAHAAAEALEQARMEWLEEWEERVRDALRRGAEDALGLARRQGEIRDALRAGGAAQRGELLAEEAVLMEGIRNLGSMLGLATRQAAGVGRELSEAVAEAMDHAGRTAEGLQGGASLRGGPQISAGEAQAALNRVALLALEGIGQVGRSDGAGTIEQFLEELEALADEQEALNRETGARAQEPGPDGQEGTDELAAAQDAVAGGLSEIARQPGAERVPGDLDELAREAEELARALEEGRLDAELLDRQRGLLDRLLSAGRLLERDGPTEEREGTPAGTVERPEVRALPGDLLRGSEIPLPSAEALERLSPAERRLVLDYFDRLNRRGGGGR